ncbi:50S ribosomal protein L11 methyltransferase [Planotetraspora sp. A-T 1434]|uniref:class I SAM-dependent methyltransferase n=1 Tax=Planotetraspora sp. A-T 1434 TaxID=2979219 RepID=UPI0021C11E0A|nr:50S ribosomal protein L11 methyltransferase [Planotetraspora sp. A-T 1434]MCT9930365.1 50S ribosomal protein L11 methyltransferase [Planotetraspora sp. A-T 1434]
MEDVEGAEDVEDFVRAHTRLAAVPYVPEILLHQVPPLTPPLPPSQPSPPARPDASGDQPPGDQPDDPGGEARDGALYAIWERTGRLPFWAYAWAGGQALARHVLDHPELVRGRTVLDLATGSGLVAIASALAGAARVTANDIDPHALAATALNARANGVTVAVVEGDLLGHTATEDVVLAGDVFYEKPLARRVMPFLERARGVVLVGDPERGCSYLPAARFERVGVHTVPAPLEDTPRKRTTIWRLV